jgi:TolB protein
MDLSGKNVERISFNPGYYSSPVWSPRGDLIAFTKMLPGKGFFIGVMRPDGSGERLITRGWLVDGASWAPNGRVLMFEKESAPKKGKGIYTIDITGNNTRFLKTPYEASDPAWSNSLG